MFKVTGKVQYLRYQLSWFKCFCKEKGILCPKSRNIHEARFVHSSVSLKDKLLIWHYLKKKTNQQTFMQLTKTFVLCYKRKLMAFVILCVNLNNSHTVISKYYQVFWKYL